MALRVDKYRRPTELKNLTYHLEQGSRLAQMVKNDDFPHLLFYGPSGAGEKTRIHCTLRELYRPVDRVVIQEIVKQIAQSPQLNTPSRAFKVVVLMEVDRPTLDAQHALRRTMENYTGNCRLILSCEQVAVLFISYVTYVT